MDGKTPVHKDCYGEMFPDVLHLREDQRTAGKVFACELTRAGGLWRSDRRVSFDSEEWDACVRCPEFERCYLLSMGKLALTSALNER